MTPDQILSIEEPYDRVQTWLMAEPFGASNDIDVAEDCGVSPRFARKVRRELEESAAVRAILSDLRGMLIAEGILDDPTPGDCLRMMRWALSAYASQRSHKARNGSAAGSHQSDATTPHSEAHSRGDDNHGHVDLPSSGRRGLPRSASRVDHRGTGGRKAAGGHAEG